MTNSRPSENVFALGSALCADYGIDTVRFRWREGNLAYQEFKRRYGGTFEGNRGERFVQTELGRVGAYPDGLIYLEGRASALIAGTRDEHSLASVTELHSAERVAARIARDTGAPVSGDPARLGRVDLASELRFSNGGEGQAFLHALGSLDVPWCKQRVDGRKGSGIETVSFHGTSGKTIYLRAYDKGVESRSAAPGVRIRIERQRRYRKTREPHVAQLRSADLHSIFVGREFESLLDLDVATVCNTSDAMVSLWNRATSWQQMERLAGYLALGYAVDYPVRTAQNRRKELRDLGIYVDPTQAEPVSVNVGLYMNAAVSAWAA